MLLIQEKSSRAVDRSFEKWAGAGRALFLNMSPMELALITAQQVHGTNWEIGPVRAIKKWLRSDNSARRTSCYPPVNHLPNGQNHPTRVVSCWRFSALPAPKGPIQSVSSASSDLRHLQWWPSHVMGHHTKPPLGFGCPRGYTSGVTPRCSPRAAGYIK